jgi:Tol biopolymer transport system component
MRLDLEHVAIPDEAGAEERAWRVVQVAYAEREPSKPRARRGRLLLAIATACVIGTIVAVGVSPAGSALLHSIRGEIGLTHAAPALTRLPAPGALLVSSAPGPWLVQPDGSKRLLGLYAEASLSPHGLYVAVTRRHELLAVDPKGTVHWSLARKGNILLPRWAPDGYRIAYLDGASLRIVAGDGTGDHALAQAAAQVPAAWRPSASHEHVVAYVTQAGGLVLIDVDTGRVLARDRLRGPAQLAWSTDGQRLAAVTPHAIAVFGHDGAPLATIPLRRRSGAIAFVPGTHHLSVVLGGARSDAVTYDLDRPHHEPQEVFSGSGRFSALTWSPNGRWLLIAWPTANQWLFVAHDGRATAVADIAAQFDTSQAPAPAGWCC